MRSMGLGAGPVEVLRLHMQATRRRMAQFEDVIFGQAYLVKISESSSATAAEIRFEMSLAKTCNQSIAMPPVGQTPKNLSKISPDQM